MDFGAELTHWTIRVALLCLVLRIAGTLRWGRNEQWFRWSRGIWTIGCAFFLCHVACAFGFYHHWSHAEAFDSTARQTGDMLGVQFGEGIYFSYIFTLLWVGDVAWQWLAPARYQRRSAWAAGLLAYMAFIAFNGAVIFEGGLTRWVGIPVTVALIVGTIIVLLRKRAPQSGRTDSSSLVPGP
jgi:hypothetical protein